MISRKRVFGWALQVNGVFWLWVLAKAAFPGANDFALGVLLVGLIIIPLIAGENLSRPDPPTNKGP